MSGVNDIPNGWVETTLADSVSKLGDGLHGTPKYSEEGEYYFINGNNLNDGKIEIKKETKRCSTVEYEKYKKDLNSRTILVSINGSLGYFAYYNNENCFLGKSACYFNVKDSISKKFIGYQIRRSYFQKYIRRLAGGTTIKNVSLKTMREYPFLIPKDIAEQKAIANILTAFDDKIENVQAQNKTLEETAQTIFKEWFKNESEDWEWVKINELVEISSSKRIFHSEYVDDGIPFYRGKEVIELSTKPNISTELFITEERYNEIKEKHQVPIKGDILLTAVGTLGVPFQVRNYKPFYFKDGNLIWFKNFSNKMPSDFLYNWLKLKTTQNQLNTISIGSTQKALTITSIKELEIPLILAKEKREIFDKVLSSNLDKVNHNLAQIQSLKKTRDTLLPKLMSGQLRVNDFKD